MAGLRTFRAPARARRRGSRAVERCASHPHPLEFTQRLIDAYAGCEARLPGAPAGAVGLGPHPRRMKRGIHGHGVQSAISRPCAWRGRTSRSRATSSWVSRRRRRSISRRRCKLIEDVRSTALSVSSTAAGRARPPRTSRTTPARREASSGSPRLQRRIRISREAYSRAMGETRQRVSSKAPSRKGPGRARGPDGQNASSTSRAIAGSFGELRDVEIVPRPPPPACAVRSSPRRRPPCRDIS